MGKWTGWIDGQFQLCPNYAPNTEIMNKTDVKISWSACHRKAYTYLMYLNIKRCVLCSYCSSWKRSQNSILYSQYTTSFFFPRITMLADGSLKIYNITKSDAGVYTCIATNQFGIARNSGNLIVKGILLSSFVHYEYWKCTCIFDETKIVLLQLWYKV